MKKLIKDATDLFNYIDSDFKNWDVDEGVTESVKLIPNKLEKNSTFQEMFKETNCVSQSDMLDWVENNRDEIFKTGYSYLFPLKNSKGDKFVAYVFRHGGRLEVSVHEFSDGYVWLASDGDIFILPQPLKSS